MKRLLALVVLLALVGVALYYWKYRPAGESPREALGAVGDKIRSAKTTGEIKAALELNRNLKSYPIEVDVAADGTATLRGGVPREDYKAEAERVTAAVPDVSSVRNEIAIDPALPMPDEGGRTLGENFDDKALEAKVKLAFSLNKALDGADLKVRAYRREVTVGGEVDTPEQHQLALKVAADTADVIKVSDEIRLRGQAAAPPPASKSPATAPSGRREGVKTTTEIDLAGLLARDLTGAQVDDSASEVRL